jgi:hypothetical protein
VRGEGQGAKKASNLVDVLGIIGRYEQVEVNRRTLAGPDPIAQLDVGEDEIHLGEAAGLPLREHLLIDIDAIVVRDAERADPRH